MNALQAALGVGGFGAAAVAYLVAAALVLRAHPGTRQADWLLAGLLTSVVWAGALAYAIWAGRVASRWVPALDGLHVAVWVLFLAVVLRTSARAESPVSQRLPRLLTLATVVLTAGVLLLAWLPAADGFAETGNRVWLISTLIVPVLGLLSLEQIYRNSDPGQRRVLKPLALGVGIIFAIDIFVYSQGVLFSGISLNLWLLRGAANAAAAPLIILAVKRQPDWEHELFVSRHIVFYTASLVGAGLYLVAMSAGGYLVLSLGLSWGPLLQALFFVSAAAVFVYALFSATVHRRLRVFIAKHFYRNRYDYRQEWLRLMKTLAGGHDEASLAERGVKAVAEIIGSRRGELWLIDASRGTFEGHAGWNGPRPAAALGDDDVLVRFLRHRLWVIDTHEYARDPEKYANAFPADDARLAKPSIFVPLVHEGALVGIVRLDRPPGLDMLGFEDHDLLKTAGQQVAIFLMQELAKDELAQTRQFEAFSKLTAFLMHDLKNLIAQQELVVANARWFKHKPEFVDDAIRTIESSVQRMRRVLGRLQGDAATESMSRVDVRKLLEDVRGSCADRSPVPEIVPGETGVRVAMDRDKLAMAVTHAVRNAQDATRSDGRIEMRLLDNGETATIEVEDDGVGMDADFVRDRLFKPFDSTKGAKGMGIGAYQIRETLRAAGGDVEVTSAPGRGTLVRMILPVSEPVAGASGHSAA